MAYFKPTIAIINQKKIGYSELKALVLEIKDANKAWDATASAVKKACRLFIFKHVHQQIFLI
jgi:hypothetical protein